MPKHAPERTCIGCRAQEKAHNMVRVTVSDSRSVTVDPAGTRPGRGAWLHHDPACLSQALRRKAFNRAFKSAVDTSGMQELVPEWSQPVTETKTNQESGSENR